MAETLIERPDIAQGKANRLNEAIFPNTVIPQNENFAPASTPIYVYNIFPLEHKRGRFPNHPHMLIRACPRGEEWKLVGQEVHPFEEVDYDQNGNRVPRWTSGYKEVTRMLNPANNAQDFSDPIRVQDFEVEDPMNVGDNLNAYGVFWSVNYPPRQEELTAARARLEKTLALELKRMGDIEAKNPQEARDAANWISHAAAEYYGQVQTWHPNLSRKDSPVTKVDCGACGEKIQPVAKICIHCGAPTDPEKQARWLEAKFRGPGRPKSEDAA